MGEAVSKGGGSLDGWEPNLANVGIHREPKDAAYLVHRHTPAGYKHRYMANKSLVHLWYRYVSHLTHGDFPLNHRTMDGAAQALMFWL